MQLALRGWGAATRSRSKVAHYSCFNTQVPPTNARARPEREKPPTLKERAKARAEVETDSEARRHVQKGLHRYSEGRRVHLDALRMCVPFQAS